MGAVIFVRCGNITCDVDCFTQRRALCVCVLFVCILLLFC